MASPVPENLQPLHTFLQTHLKWKHRRGGRIRLAGEASSSPPLTSNPWLQSPPVRSHTHAPSPHRRHTSPPNASWRPSPPHKQSTIHDLEFEADPNYACLTSKRKFSESPTKSEDNDNKGKRSNEISFRFLESIKQHDAAAEEDHTSIPVDDSVLPKAADDESSPRKWNLRPRRLPVTHYQSTGSFSKIRKSRLPEKRTSRDITNNKQLSELNNYYNSDTRTTGLPKISISLSRDEIEEDVLFLTGSKTSRRPKKRPRAIQKQLDNLFPGLWLDSITADSYKVSETPKG